MFRVATGDCLGEYADTAPGDQFYDKTVKSVIQIEEPIGALFFITYTLKARQRTDCKSLILKKILHAFKAREKGGTCLQMILCQWSSIMFLQKLCHFSKF